MKRLFSPKIIIPVVLVLLLLGVAGVVGYILFAPESWWKPFYVKLETDEATAASDIEGDLMPGQDGEGLPKGTTTPQDGDSQAQPASNLQNPPGIMYELDNKVVNLAEPGGLRYLQAAIVLELWPLAENYYELEEEERDQADEDFLKLIDARRPIIDDIVTTKLSSKSFNEIATVEGKQELKDELKTAINDALGYQGVTNVYFTSFVVQ